ncbi:MAG: hypothetical protein K2Y32_00240 [Candidatus Obscuribacterales bacterium]|nr:hypothetical protein [Candidatus Obscuribacterales bacterium]
MSALSGDVKYKYYGVLMRSGRCWDADAVEPFHSGSVEAVLAEAKQYNWNFPEYDYLFVYDENNVEVVEAQLVNAE